MKAIKVELIKVAPMLGAHISAVAEECIAVAAVLSAPVHFKFNDLEMVVHGDTTVYYVVTSYNRRHERRHERAVKKKAKR